MNNKHRTPKLRRLFLAIMLILFVISASKAQIIEGGGTFHKEIGGVKKAEKLYKDLAYSEAIPLYEKYLKKNDSVRAMTELADCYRLTSKYEKAEFWYNKAVATGSASSETKLRLAQMLQVNGKYEEAAKWYTQYLAEAPEDKRSKNELQSSLHYEEYLQSRLRYTVQNLSFNSPGYDFSSTAYDGGLIFSSSRDSAKGIGREHTWTGTQFFDMWYVKGDKVEFGKPQRMKGDATTKWHEGVSTFTPDFKKVYFTRNDYVNGKVKASNDKIIKLNIYESDVDGRNWKNDKRLPFNSDEYSAGHPALTPDGNTMYFISDMPGGYGQTDIYVTTKEGESWSTPKNLGPEINTEGREMFPFVDKDGELYFASDGHGGLGGLDNFRTKQNTQTKSWGKIRNIGAPINSSYDDYGMHYGNDKSYGYFTSDRPGGKGLDDIYSFTDDGISLEGIVVDAETGKPICNSQVIMNAKETSTEQGRKNTECNGEFDFAVLKNTDYCFKGSAQGYAPNNTVCATTKGVGPGGKVFVRIPLVKQKPVSLIVLVRDRKSKKPIDSAQVILAGDCDGIRQQSITDATGSACDSVQCECNYTAVASARGYLPNSNTGSTVGRCKVLVDCGEAGGDTLIVELDRLIGDADGNTPPSSLDSNLTIELKDIYYDFDKWFIRQESEVQLNKLLSFIQENPDALVEIASHTDARAPYDYNIKLSQRRAQSVVDWLIAKGVSKDKLRPKGYGETQPRNECKDGVRCTEFEHQRNRRTEFRIVGGKINLKSLERFDMQIDPCKICPF